MAREREQAIKVLAGVTDQLSDGGSYLLLGQLLSEEESWTKAMKALQAALKAGDLNGSETEMARLLLGITAYRAGDKKLATLTFEQLGGHPDLGKTADHWLTVVKAADGRIGSNE